MVRTIILKLGSCCTSLPRGCQSVEIWHAYIQNYKIRFQLFRFLHRLAPVRGLPQTSQPSCICNKADKPRRTTS